MNRERHDEVDLEDLDVDPDLEFGDDAGDADAADHDPHS